MLLTHFCVSSVSRFALIQEPNPEDPLNKGTHQPACSVSVSSSACRTFLTRRVTLETIRLAEAAAMMKSNLDEFTRAAQGRGHRYSEYSAAFSRK
jgi:hypothetical protein